MNFDSRQSSVPDDYELQIKVADVVELSIAICRFFIIADGPLGLRSPDMRVG